MPTIIEKLESRGGEEGVEKQSRSLMYLVKLNAGETEQDAIDAVRSEAPTTYRGLYFSSIRFSIKAEAIDILEFEVAYSSTEPKKPPSKTPKSGGQNDDGRDDPGDGEFVFDTKGGREKIYYSRETVRVAGVNNGAVPDFKGGINVSSNGVGGIDITVPTFKFSIAKKLPLAQMTGAYVRTLFLMTGKTNNNPWTVNYRGIILEFEKREVLFMGASGIQRGNDSVSLNFSFEGYPNVKNLVIGSDSNIGNIQVNGQWVLLDKYGTDYLWVNFEPTKVEEKIMNAAGVMEAVPGSGRLIDMPIAAYVERVYEQANFNLLRL
jgi:hypothetical protein